MFWINTFYPSVKIFCMGTSSSKGECPTTESRLEATDGYVFLYKLKLLVCAVRSSEIIELILLKLDS